jgi:hypothetical protein
MVITLLGGLDLGVLANHLSAPASVGWGVGVFLFGLVLAVIGNIIVQWERLRVRREVR